MVATMTERISATVAQSCNHARRGQAVRAEPSARIRERERRGEHDPTNGGKPARDRRAREGRVAREIFFVGHSTSTTLRGSIGTDGSGLFPFSNSHRRSRPNQLISSDNTKHYRRGGAGAIATADGSYARSRHLLRREVCRLLNFRVG